MAEINNAAPEMCDKIGTTTCDDLIPPRNLMTVNADTNLFEILQMMEKHRIHSFPIEAVSKSTGKRSVVGMLDITDVICTLFDAAHFDSMRNKGSHEFDPGVVAEHFIDTRKLKEALTSISAMSLLAQRRKNQHATGYGEDYEANMDEAATPFGPEVHRLYLYPDDPIPVVLAKLGRCAKHRLPIVEGTRLNDSCDLANASFSSASSGSGPNISPGKLFGHHGAIINLLSQSDVVKFLFKHKSELPEKYLKTPLAAIMNTNLISVHPSSSLAQALFLYKTKKVMCVLVEDAKGRLIAPLAATDFVDRASDLTTFSLAVDEFLAPKDSEDAKIKDGNVHKHIVPFTMTVEGALERFAQGRIYRLLVESEEDTLTPARMAPGTRQGPALPTYGFVKGIITLRDVLMEASNYYPVIKEPMS